MTKIELICPNCKSVFNRYKSTIRKNQKYVYCSKKCKGEYEKSNKLLHGENNPNYGKTWSTQQRKLASNKMVGNNKGKSYEDLYGKCRSDDLKNQRSVSMKEHRSKNPISGIDNPFFGKTHDEKTKRIIGEKSKDKFTDDYMTKYRTVMENAGHWIPLKDKSDYEIYFKQAEWCEKMFDRASDVEILLLREYGVFNNKTNTKGVVRDHIYSRKSGFENGVFPILLRHPANCGIITHSDNVKKKTSRYIDKDGHTIDELFLRIETYKNKWIEHDDCLMLIDDYINGKRWKREEEL